MPDRRRYRGPATASANMTKLTDAWIQAQLELCEAATEGPWFDGFGDGSGRIGETSGGDITLEENIEDPFACVVSGGDWGGMPIGVLKQCDMDFIIAVREGYPLVLREVQRLRELETSWQHATKSWRAEEQSWREQMDDLHKDMALLAEVFERST